MSKETERKEIERKDTQFKVLKNEHMEEEMRGLSINFPRVKVPSGEGNMFISDDFDVSLNEIEGVILYHHPLWLHYEEEYTGNSQPPSCYSLDGITGFSDNTRHKCIDCAKSQFGTGKNGGKQCQNKHRLFILRENRMFPLVLILPVCSVKFFRNYLQNILNNMCRSRDYITKITLDKATNKNGMKYNHTRFEVVRKLHASEIKSLDDIVNNVKKYAKTSNIADIYTDLSE